MHQQLANPAPLSRSDLGMQIAGSRHFQCQARPGPARPGRASCQSRRLHRISLRPDDVCHREPLFSAARLWPQQQTAVVSFVSFASFSSNLETMNERQAQRQQAPRKCCGCDTNAASGHNKHNKEVGVLLKLVLDYMMPCKNIFLSLVRKCIL